MAVEIVATDPELLKTNNTILQRLDLLKVIESEAVKKGFSGDTKDTLHPSSASVLVKGKYTDFVIGSCLRQQWLKVKGYKPDRKPSPHLSMTAELGNMVEAYVVNSLRANNILLAPTQFGRQVAVFDKELNLSGFIDAIVEEETGSEPTKPIIVEVKSFYGYNTKKGLTGFKKRINKKWCPVPPSPKPEHLLQASIYLNNFKDRVAGAKILYFARDDATTAQFNILLYVGEDNLTHFTVNNRPVQWFTMEAIFDRFTELRNYIDTDTLPPCDFMKAYTKEKLENLWKEQEEAKEGPATKLIGKTNYELAHKDLTKIGKTSQCDWQCSYCDFRKTCEKLDKSAVVKSPKEIVPSEDLVFKG